MTTKKNESMIPDEIVHQLRAPLPREASKQHPTKAYLSTIKAIYVVERLNDVFGLGGWRVTNEVIENDPEKKMIIVKSTFHAPEYGIIIPDIFGGNDNDDRGDAYKGACTDALTKIGSYLYVGMDIFKGINDGRNTAAPAKPAVQITRQAAPTPIAPPASQDKQTAAVPVVPSVTKRVYQGEERLVPKSPSPESKPEAVAPAMKPNPTTVVQAALPETNMAWLTEKQFSGALSRINAGEIDLLDKLKSTFRMKKAYREELEAAVKFGQNFAQGEESIQEPIQKQTS